MLKSKKRWITPEINEQLVEQLQKESNLSPVVVKYFVSQGITNSVVMKEYLEMDEQSLHDPLLLFQMKEAVERVQQAIQLEEKILVYGDYDADGITSTSVMLSALHELGANATYEIPNRFDHGYGPSLNLFKQAIKDNVTLIITVDNGVSGHEAIEFARLQGVDVIVTDHHEIGETLPNANFIIHPRHPEGVYPFTELAGVGVAFKFACALLNRVPEELLDLVAIGTIADLVSLKGENRYLVKKGIAILQRSKRFALQALANIAGFDLLKADEETIGFAIGPRLNAIGRLGDAKPGVEFILSTSMDDATFLAKEIDKANKARQAIVAKMTEEATELAEQVMTESTKVLVIAKSGWNPGVVGIVASKLVDKYYLPTVILGIDDEKGIAKGSARSIEGFHLFNELSKNGDILPHFGGHPMAAGMTLQKEDVDELRTRLNDQAQHVLSDTDLIPIEKIDITLTLPEISVKEIESFQQLKPFGMDFPKPIFHIQESEVASIRKIGSTSQHVKMVVESNGATLDCIAFFKSYLADELYPETKISLIGDLQINEWNGKKNAQLLVKDVKALEWQLHDIRGVRQVNRWEHLIPKENSIVVYFNRASVQQFESVLSLPLHHIESLEESLDEKNVVFLDMPESEKQLEAVFTAIPTTKVYTHFYVSDDVYLESIPTRDQFKWYYGFLLKRDSFYLEKHIDELAKHKGWSKSKLNFMTKVFFDLGFVKINNGLVETVSNAPKRDLSESLVYQEHMMKSDLARRLLYAPKKELKEWFEQNNWVRTVSEEEQERWI
ncbi:single-stranded-DNA-specific exonuclease RecJ [Paenisporosarcina cavernae]|uniref:Single-stranded-DNA-specific exonuclease RecJ n=1 Tax=Paenisporosarcina cavernae TaxID=2320858 RepID=A0A385YV75_9BACL|nr:single-stranded-DNA-specific exonuclease RecJ [Paenisporosarcina cavernae]